MATAQYLHDFGNDALGAVCNQAMARVMAGIDNERAQAYESDALWIAEYMGRQDWRASAPAEFNSNPKLLDAFNDGSFEAMLIAQPEPAQQNAFDAAAWTARCEDLSTEAAKGCGCSDLLYSSRYSSMVDGALNRIPPEHHAEALNIARLAGDYTGPDEDKSAWDGCCPHGLDPDCCPAGCGDRDDFVNDDVGRYYF